MGVKTTNQRFSKKELARFLRAGIEYRQRQYNFDPDDGCAQVQGKGEKINRVYGEWDVLNTLMEEFDLWGIETEDVA